MKKTTIIFDFDGTIANTFPYIFEIIKKLAIEQGITNLTDKDLLSVRDKHPLEAIKMFNIPILKLPFLVIRGQKMLKKNINQVKLFPGIKEVLYKLKEKGYHLGVLSSNSVENLNLFFKKNQIAIFDFVKSSSNIFGKAWSLRSIVKDNKLRKEEVVYIGDEVRDIEACHDVGIDIIAVTWGFNSKNILKKYQPEYLVAQPAELLTLII